MRCGPAELQNRCVPYEDMGDPFEEDRCRTLTVLRRAALGALVAALTVGSCAGAAQAAPDAPGAPGGATATTAQDRWVPGTLASRGDVDTYRFTTTTGRYARILLGDLAADYRLRLLDAAGRVVATSDRRGRANEEVYRHLPAGTWFASVSAPRGTVSRAPYVVRFSSLGEGVHVLSRVVQNLSPTKHASGRRFVFEVLNNTPHTLDGFTWSLRQPCTPPACLPYEYSVTRAVPPRGRTVITDWTGELPGRGEVLTVSAGNPIDHLPRLSVNPGIPGSRDPYQDHYSPRVTNRGDRVASCVRIYRNAYDDRGHLVQHQTHSTGPARLQPGTTWAQPKRSMGYYFPAASATRTAWRAEERGPTTLPC